MLAYRRAADADPRDGRLRSPSSRSTGSAKELHRDRQDDRGEDRPGRRGRRDARADEAQERSSRRRSSRSCACPGSARRPRARIWKELGVTTIAELKRGGRAGAAAHASPGSARRREEQILQGARRGDAGAVETERLLGDGAARAARASSRCCAAHPGRGRGLGGGQRAPAPGDVPRPRHHRDRHRPGRADRLLHEAARGSPRSSRRARRRRPCSRNEGLRFDLRVVPPESLRQPAPALHRLEGPQRRAARGRRAARPLRLRVLGHDRRDRRGASRRADEEELYEQLGYAVHPARAARERAASSRRRARASCRSSSSSATSAATCTPLDLVGRQGDARGDGARRRRRAGYEYLAICRPLAPAPRRTARSAQWRGDRRAERAARAVPDPEGDRGQHPRRTASSTSPTSCSPSSTG